MNKPMAWKDQVPISEKSELTIWVKILMDTFGIPQGEALVLLIKAWPKQIKVLDTVTFN